MPFHYPEIYLIFQLLLKYHIHDLYTSNRENLTIGKNRGIKQKMAKNLKILKTEFSNLEYHLFFFV